jgi:hypothetical protein
MSDEPIMEMPSRVRDLEMRAINAYRAKNPDGPLWQELSWLTRGLWLQTVEEKEKKQ